MTTAAAQRFDSGDIFSVDNVIFAFVLLYVMLFSLWPGYLDVRFTEKVGLNPQRILTAVLFFLFCYAVISNRYFRERLVDFLKKNRFFSLAIFGYLFLRVVSSVHAGGSSILFFINELLTNFALFFICISLDIEAKKFRIACFVMVITLFIVSLFGIYEHIFEYNFLRNFISGDNKLSLTALAVKYRSGSYRSQSTFEHPLALTQFIVLLLPFALLSRIGIKNYIIIAFGFAFAIMALYFTYSRSGILCLLLTFTLVAFLRLRELKIVKSQRHIYLGLLLLCGLFLVGSVGAAGYYLSQGSTTGEESSTRARLVQLYNGAKAIKESPLIGYGPGNAAGVLFGIANSPESEEKMYRESIDNLYLTRAIESGIPAVILFLYINIYIGYVLYKETKKMAFNRRLKFYFILTGIVGVMCVTAILSIFTVLPLFFLSSGLAIAYALRQNTCVPAVGA
jgi:O-antigen ligase